MQRYFFDMVSGDGGRVTDSEGMEFASLEAAKEDALHSLGLPTASEAAEGAQVSIEIRTEDNVEPLCTVNL